ncbi:class Ib ribonucleoside-diphosphate reductase assembly flavoprotein NrdI [Treponema pectinovorum]|uniref:class Ib ribonucleoside-diphosphate reductase assembly flavoprotein NrdI n=1 Tax=Treponema pectinovorum TaxID=164 RepID=UPI0011C80248|nr:class Ib ribonucleoside-diphosphate reductase assembly flavoprotein NrdI [Treponema pectinovorum]
MKIIYATAHGSTRKFLDKLAVTDALEIKDGSEKVSEDFILFTPTTGNGLVPENVKTFLKDNHLHLKAVVGNCSSARHSKTFGFAADAISQEYKVPVLFKYEGEGSQSDVTIMKNLIAAW